MNKLFVGLAIVAAIVVAWFILNPGDTFDYVVTVESEIAELENELATVEAQVAAGSLTEEEATTAKVQIITRLNAINTAATESEQMRLTPGQRLQLMEGLDRLKVILITYQETLSAVEASADETEVRAEVIRRGGSYNRSKPLNLIVADTIADVEDTVTDSIRDYEANTELDSQIDIIIDEVEVEAMTESETDTTIGEETMTNEEATTTETEDSTTTDEETENEEPTDEEIMIDTEVSTEAELEATAN